MNKIAILGANSHLAKGIIYNMLAEINPPDLDLYARNKDIVSSFIKNQCIHKRVRIYDDFYMLNNIEYDVIINCIGISNPQIISKTNYKIFEITERFDNLIINYLEKNTSTLYINFSSGAVYGNSFENEAESKRKSIIDIDNINNGLFYSIAKLNTEAKHRSLTSMKIIDIRIFSYFSRFIDLSYNFLISDIIRSIINNKPMITNKYNIVRDYVHMEDLYIFICKCIQADEINNAFNIYSKSTINKFDLLESFKNKYNLRYEVKNDCDDDKTKQFYYHPIKSRFQELDYNPKYTSMEAIMSESSYLLNNIS